METQKVAIVLLNWNGEKWLKKFLPRLITESPGINIYLADNNSTDKSIEFIENNFPAVIVIQHNDNYGYCKGYNIALREIDAEYLILINSDIEVSEDWVSPITKLMDQDISIGACQPKILDYNNKTFFEYAGACGGFIDILGYPFCRGRIFQTLEKDNGQYNDNIEVFWATGACLFIRSKTFWEAGGFDEDFFAHMEEIDLCWRMKHLGYKIMACPASVVYHVGGGTLHNSSSLKTYLNFRNNLIMLFKNLPLFQLIWILPVRFILDGIAALSFLSNNQNGYTHLFSVFKAHLSFYTKLPILIKKRWNTNTETSLTGRFSFSILGKYYLMKYKKYSDL